MPRWFSIIWLVCSLTLFSSCSSGDGGDRTTNPPTNDPLSVSVSSIDFDYFEDSEVITVRNEGSSTFTWTATPNRSWVELDSTTGDLDSGQSVAVTVSVLRDGLTTGTHTATVTVQATGSDNQSIAVSLDHYDEDVVVLGFAVIDAEYDLTNDVWVAVSQSPSELHVIDAAAKTYQSVSLSVTPQCVSIRPDGAYAAVGHNAWITRVDLNTLQAETPVQVSTNAHDIVLSPNDWAYVFPRGNGWDNIRSVQLPAGTESQDPMWDVYADSKARLHPSGSYIYAADNGVSPSDVEKYDISSGTASHLYDSPYHGDYAFSGNIWISDDGSRIFARSGNMFNATNDQQTDMTYAGALSGVDYVTWAHHSSATNKLYVCWATGIDVLQMNDIRVYDGSFFQYEESYAVPNMLIPDGLGGGEYANVRTYYCSANSTGTSLHALVRHGGADIWAAASIDISP